MQNYFENLLKSVYVKAYREKFFLMLHKNLLKSYLKAIGG